MRFRETAVTLRVLLALPAILLSAGPASVAEQVNYLRDIKPMLRSRCYACHGALRQKNKLRLDTAELIRKGGASGPAVVPGKSGDSLLLDAVTGNGMDRMPPEGDGKPLSAGEIALLKAWIDQGARGPREAVPEDPRRHWAFRNPVRGPLPRIADPRWSGNPIDRFIAARHEKQRLRPNGPAARRVLLRRVHLDLTGLPPTRQVVHAFLADNSPGAYERVVDRILASPQYGERWARHWMDVWRYSDWYGRRSVPDVWNSAPQIWRWRDWIVKSLNADKGYDRMVMEMLAADEIAPLDGEAVVATGYIVRNWYALNYNQWMRDMVEHTGKAFLGLTMNCAHCHDHKYDPISQEEYFRFRAFFEPLELRQDRVPGEPDPGPFQKYQYLVLRKIVRAGAIRVFDEKVNAKTYMYQGGDERERFKGRPPVQPGAPAFLGGDRLKIAPVNLPPAAYYPGIRPFIQKEETVKAERVVASARAELASAGQALARSQKNPKGPDAKVTISLARAKLATAQATLEWVRARVAADNARYKHSAGNAIELARAAGKAERFAKFCSARELLVQAEQAVKAASRKPGKVAVNAAQQRLVQARKNVEAARQALALPAMTYTPLSPVYPARSTGRRRSLAQWIASQKNPLTARVAVNHIWMRHFGRPLVETVFDFGRNGKKPTHPELLDWLAVEFMESGWSMKKLHRLMVTSQTYRMDSGSRPGNPNLTLDRDNQSLWHFEPKRLEAEVVRDSLLHVSGDLNSRMGGQELENDAGATSHRRSLYFSIYPESGGHLTFLEQFDTPDPCDCYRRSESIVPQQALALTNSRLALRQSRLLARKLWTEVVNEQQSASRAEDAFLLAAFEQILSRRPTGPEQKICTEFLAKQAELFRSVGPKGLAGQGKAGVAPSTDPAMRARESLVRVLFNHTDFVTVR